MRMCEVYNKLKSMGAVSGKYCIYESICEKDQTPPDDFNAQIHCIVSSGAKMFEANLTEPSAEDLINEHEKKSNLND